MKYRDVLARLRRFGVVEYKRRGKGSGREWIRETEPGSKKGRVFMMKCHGEGREVAAGTLSAALRRLGISRDEFYS